MWQYMKGGSDLIGKPDVRRTGRFLCAVVSFTFVLVQEYHGIDGVAKRHEQRTKEAIIIQLH